MSSLLSTTAQTEFQCLYLKYFGHEISLEQANDMGLELLNFFKLIYKPIPKKDSYLFEKAEPVYEIL